MDRCHIIRLNHEGAVPEMKFTAIKEERINDEEFIQPHMDFTDPPDYLSFKSSDSGDMANFDLSNYVNLLEHSINETTVIQPDFELKEESKPVLSVDQVEVEVDLCENVFDDTEDDGKNADDLDADRNTDDENGESSFVCGVCSCNFESVEDLIPHMAEHSSLELNCEETEDITNDSSSDETQIVSRNAIIAAGKRFLCEICSTWFSEIDHLSEHKAAMHFMNEAIKCKFCEKSFTEEKTLKRHMVVHMFVCEVCKKRLPNQYCLEMHLLLHTEKKPLNVCRKTFPKRVSKRKNDPIPNGVDFSCGVCGKRYQNIGNLKRHIKSHSSGKVFECSLCPQRFNAKGNLKAHIKLHSGVRPYKCKMCSKSFTMRANLKRHILSHTGERPYGCTKCSKRFAERGSLIKHQTFHTNEKAFPCPICNKKLSEFGTLKRHINMHKGRTPHKCEVCSKAFVTQVSLRNHMVIHSGDKPFECEVCGKQFTYKGNLKQHKVSIHMGINHRMYKSSSKEERRKALEKAEEDLMSLDFPLPDSDED